MPSQVCKIKNGHKNSLHRNVADHFYRAIVELLRYL